MNLRALALCALPLLCSGCLTRAELDQARLVDLRYTTRVIGYAVDAYEASLQSRLSLLRALEDDPRFRQLSQELGTIQENEARLRRVRAGKQELLTAGRALMSQLTPP